MYHIHFIIQYSSIGVHYSPSHSSSNILCLRELIAAHVKSSFDKVIASTKEAFRLQAYLSKHNRTFCAGRTRDIRGMLANRFVRENGEADRLFRVGRESVRFSSL
jgi:hypothetical protein